MDIFLLNTPAKAMGRAKGDLRAAAQRFPEKGDRLLPPAPVRACSFSGEQVIITPDSNAAENAVRPFVVGRKSWLFAGVPSGVDAAATVCSLIETAKACGVDPYPLPTVSL